MPTYRLDEILDLEAALYEARKFASEQQTTQPDMTIQTASFKGFEAGAKYMASKMSCYILQETLKGRL